MSIAVACPCGKALKAKASHAGRKARCPECGNPVVIPMFHSPAASPSRWGWIAPAACGLVVATPFVMWIALAFHEPLPDPVPVPTAAPAVAELTPEPVPEAEATAAVAVPVPEAEAAPEAEADTEAVPTATVADLPPPPDRFLSPMPELVPETEGEDESDPVMAPSPRPTPRRRRVASAPAVPWLRIHVPSYTPPRPSSSYSGGGTVSVRGYYRKNGTYVAPHTRRAPRRR